MISGRAAPSAVTVAAAANGSVDGALADADGIEPTVAFLLRRNTCITDFISINHFKAAVHLYVSNSGAEHRQQTFPEQHISIQVTDVVLANMEEYNGRTTSQSLLKLTIDPRTVATVLHGGTASRK